MTNPNDASPPEDKGKENRGAAQVLRYPRPPNGSSLVERLEFFSIPEPNSGCLLWLGRLRRGYPGINIDGVSHGAHRVVLERKLGRPLLPHEFACHKCDVKPCIAEDHLYAGTHAENMAEMSRKGRQRRHSEYVRGLEAEVERLRVALAVAGAK